MSKLIITEKPSVAANIAAALGITDRKNGYLEGNGYMISWCVGHLVELAQPDAYGEQYKKWTYESLPIMPEKWSYVLKEGTKEQFDILCSLMRKDEITSIVCATDAGREGELIFRLVYKMAGCTKEIERLWISSMEELAIREGMNQLKPGRKYDNLYQAALCRQRADWLVGINGTRLFTVLYKNKVLKVGRVQTPTLAMLVDREAAIQTFKKEPYYTVELLLGDIKAVSGKYKTSDEAAQIAKSCGEEAFVVAYNEERKILNPPKLYDLTTLQRDANKYFGFTAKQTAEYTQNLYESKLVTYPRTDSNYLTDDMEETANEIIRAIKGNCDFVGPFEKDRSHDCKRVLNSRKVTDHHAIIPTMEYFKGETSLSESEKKIFDLIACRMICATGEKNTYKVCSAIIDCNDTEFTMSGKQIEENGWKVYEDSFRLNYKLKASNENGEESSVDEEHPVFGLTEGELLKVSGTSIKEGFTKPPVHFTEASLLAAMERAGANEMSDEVERKGLGTPATRADIIEKLVKDGYVRREKKQMIPTDDGLKLITVLPDVVKSPQLTADWENQLTLVSKGEVNADDFMNGIENMVQDLIHTYNSVSDSERANYFATNQESLGDCPHCGKPIYKGKYGVYCSGKCGMSLGRAMGATLSDDEVKTLLQGKKILVRGLRGKSGKVYDAYLSPVGIEPYSYVGEDKKERSGFQYKFEMTFPKTKKK